MPSVQIDVTVASTTDTGALVDQLNQTEMVDLGKEIIERIPEDRLVPMIAALIIHTANRTGQTVGQVAQAVATELGL